MRPPTWVWNFPHKAPAGGMYLGVEGREENEYSQSCLVTSRTYHLTLSSHHPASGRGPCVVQLLSRVRLCHPMDCSTLGFPVLHYVPEFTQTHVLRVGDAIQPSHHLSSPSPTPSPTLSTLFLCSTLTVPLSIPGTYLILICSGAISCIIHTTWKNPVTVISLSK